MNFRRSRYFLGEALRGLIRNRLMSIASILTVASCLLVVSVFYALVANIDFFLNELEGTIGMAVFVYNDVDARGLETIYDELLAIDHVTSVDFISHPRAFELVLEQLDDPGILEGVPPDTFPRSFNIEISDLRYHDSVAEQIESLIHLGIERIRQDQNIAHIVVSVSNAVRWISMVLVVILAGVSIVIITNTIRITVNARHTEINIMKYIGATDWFIRWPFLIEGILIGMIGSILPVSLLWIGYDHAIRAFSEGMPLIEFVEFRPGIEIFTFLFPFVITLGAVIGAIGSVISIRRYLHV